MKKNDSLLISDNDESDDGDKARRLTLDCCCAAAFASQRNAGELEYKILMKELKLWMICLNMCVIIQKKQKQIKPNVKLSVISLC